MKNQPLRILLLCFMLSLHCLTAASTQASDSIRHSMQWNEGFNSQVLIPVLASDYCDFLNHVATASDPNFLYDTKMGSDPLIGAITRVCAATHTNADASTNTDVHYEYFVIAGRDNEPITFVNETDQAAYLQWLQSNSQSQGYSLQSDPCLKSSASELQVVISASSTLSLANLSTSSSTSNSNPYISNVSTVAAIVVLVAFAGACVTFNDLCQAADDPTNVNKQRLILSGEGANARIVPSDGTGETQTKIQNDDIATRKALKRALEQAGHPKDFVHNLVSRELPYRGMMDRFRRIRQPLSHAKLMTIINEAKATPNTITTTDQSIGITHSLSLEDSSMLTPIKITEDRELILSKAELEPVEKFRTLMTQLGTNEKAIQDLHGCLKNLQKSQQSIYVNSHQIIWDKRQQCFVEYSGEETESTVSHDSSLEEALQTLNDYVDYERAQRRADRYSIEVQDQNTPRLLDKLLSPSINLDGYSLLIAHNNLEELFSPILQPPAAGAAASTMSSHNHDRPILLFGFNVPGKSGPRLEIQEKLKKHFALTNIQSMNDYNKSLKMSASGIEFSHYLDFIKEAKEGILVDRAISDGSVTVPQAQAWASFLTNHLSEFDFSRKLSDEEGRKRFIAKNYKKITINKGISCALKKFFDSDQWDSIITILDPALSLLADVGKLLIAPSLESEALITVIDPLKTRYNTLGNGNDEIKRDNQKALTSILSEAFFRKTSKLGLEFAQATNITVGFVWKHNFSPVLPTTLQELYDYFERKPYYYFEFRKNSTSAKYPEAITCSEMRHLGRLMWKFYISNSSGGRTAPNYLLIREIEKTFPTATEEKK